MNIVDPCYQITGLLILFTIRSEIAVVTNKKLRRLSQTRTKRRHYSIERCAGKIGFVVCNREENSTLA